jgi:hypothetical protein
VFHHTLHVITNSASSAPDWQGVPKEGIMDVFMLQNLLDKINGCTFANIDSITEPSNGIRKETKGTRVILFTNKKSSGYDNMVRRRLVAAGKNPDRFSLGDLPWGKRLPNSPLIENKGKYYLQCIVLAEGPSKYYIGEREINPAGLLRTGQKTNQGLPPGEEVIVACFKLESITRIALMDEVLVADKQSVVQPSGT